MYPYCDVFRIKHTRHIRCRRHPVWVSCTRVQRDDDDKRRWERFCMSHNSLTIHNLTLLSHLTSSQRNNFRHNGPPQGGLRVKGTYWRRLSKPQGLCRLKREAEGITARAVQEEESRSRINCEWVHQCRPYVRQHTRHPQAQQGSTMQCRCALLWSSAHPWRCWSLSVSSEGNDNDAKQLVKEQHQWPWESHQILGRERSCDKGRSRKTTESLQVSAL